MTGAEVRQKITLLEKLLTEYDKKKALEQHVKDNARYGVAYKPEYVEELESEIHLLEEMFNTIFNMK
jgi:hypothetical protein